MHTLTNRSLALFVEMCYFFTMKSESTYILVLRPETYGWSLSAEMRLRALLKAAKRRYGLKCVEVREKIFEKSSCVAPTDR